MSIFNSVERFNVDSGEWQVVKSMCTKRCRLGAATVRGKIYVCGGQAFLYRIPFIFANTINLSPNMTNF